MKRVFVTGVGGLIGGAARTALEREGFAVVGCDLRSLNAAERFDFCDAEKMRTALVQCDGVLHLAAVSRVVWGETHPHWCYAVNVTGTKTLMRIVAEAESSPWLICASSREIYGTPPKLPCTADVRPCPENLYARTKLAGEKMAWQMRRRGRRVAVLRFSNVFGAIDDYADRVVPAFAAAAARGDRLNVYGGDSVLDFMPLEDAVTALVRTVQAVDDGAADLPPIDVVTGRGTSLTELAKMAVGFGDGEIVSRPARSFYPARFCGDPTPAKSLLNWQPKRTLEDAVARFVEEFKNHYANT